MIGPHDTARRHRRWAVVAFAVKILIIAGLVLLPTEIAVSLGAAHGVALAVTACAVAAALLIRRRRRHRHGSRSVPRRDRRRTGEIVKEGHGG